MQVIARRRLKEFWERHGQAEGSIRAWFAITTKARWRNSNDVKRQFGTIVDFVGDNRAIFDLSGNTSIAWWCIYLISIAAFS